MLGCSGNTTDGGSRNISVAPGCAADGSVQPGVYLLADWPGGAISSLAVSGVSWVGAGRSGLMVLHYISAAGALAMGATVGLYGAGFYGNKIGMLVGVGVGLYTAFMPVGSLMFDRILAASKTPGTTVFLIYRHRVPPLASRPQTEGNRGLGSNFLACLQFQFFVFICQFQNF